MPAIVIVGHRGGTHVGESFEFAARDLGLTAELIESADAMVAPAWLRRWNWWMRGRRPTRLEQFTSRVVSYCEKNRPRAILTTGIAPLSSEGLQKIGRLGIPRLNYLTDDPWNPAHYAPWFLRALPQYDFVFSPRRANLADLERAGCGRVSFLPFAYDPRHHFPENPAPGDMNEFESDVLFAGGADRERIVILERLAASGVKLALYGQYWERSRVLRRLTKGQATPLTVRNAVAGAKVVLGLVRRANRDDHSMRTFEVPAMRGCFMVEDTAGHREIFGHDDDAVVFFRNLEEMTDRAHDLLADPDRRERLARRAHEVVVGGMNTYRDRLRAILEVLP